MRKKLSILIASVGALGVALTLSAGPASGAGVGVTPQEVLIPVNNVNAAPAAAALYAPEGNVNMVSTPDAHVTAYSPANGSSINIKTVDSENQVKNFVIGEKGECYDPAPGQVPRVANLNISTDGTRIVFASRSGLYACLAGLPDLIEDPDNPAGVWRIWSATRVNDNWIIDLVSQSSSGQASRGTNPTINSDGSRVVFISDDPNLWPGDENQTNDLYIREINTGKTTLVSLGAGGWQAPAGVSKAQISADGLYVTWQANYSDGETQTWPSQDGSVSNIMVAQLDPNGNGTIDENTLNVQALPHPFPSANFSDRYATLVGMVLFKDQNGVLYSTKDQNGQNNTFIYTIENGELYSLPMSGTLQISTDRTHLSNGTRVYSLDRRALADQVPYSNVKLPNTSSTISATTATDDRVFVSIATGGSNGVSYEVPYGNSADGGGAATFKLNPNGQRPWYQAPPKNLEPKTIDTTLQKKYIWLSALQINISSMLSELYWRRGDVGASKPSSLIDQSSLPADQRSTISDIDNLQRLAKQTNDAMRKVKLAQQARDLLVENALCGSQNGQWCGAVRAVTATAVVDAILDVVVKKIIARFPLVAAFNIGFDAANGSCAAPLTQLVDYASVAAGQGVIALERNSGEAASWKVTQNIFAQYYGIDKPGCWDQVGVDPLATQRALAMMSPQGWGKYLDTAASIQSIYQSAEDSINQMTQNQ